MGSSRRDEGAHADLAPTARRSSSRWSVGRRLRQVADERAGAIVVRRVVTAGVEAGGGCPPPRKGPPGAPLGDTGLSHSSAPFFFTRVPPFPASQTRPPCPRLPGAAA